MTISQEKIKENILNNKKQKNEKSINKDGI